MAENGNSTEGFALGLIVAAILFLLLRREFGKRGCTGGQAPISTVARGVNASGGGCGCGGSAGKGTPPATVVSIGGESYSPGTSYASASVVPHPFTEWGSGSPSYASESAG